MAVDMVSALIGEAERRRLNSIGLGAWPGK